MFRTTSQTDRAARNDHHPNGEGRPPGTHPYRVGCLNNKNFGMVWGSQSTKIRQAGFYVSMAKKLTYISQPTADKCTAGQKQSPRMRVKLPARRTKFAGV